MRFALVLLALFANACAKTPEKPEATYAPPAVEGDPIAAEKTNLLKLIDFKIGDTIKLDSPKRFIQVFILFTMMQHEEAIKVSASGGSDEEISEMLNQSRDNFYRGLGITEEEYAAYGNKNGDKIAAFLAENPDFQTAYDFILEQGTEF